jgi:probable O-glycosylation ligase (exosortase A-associated)
MEKGLLFTYTMTYGGAAVSLFYPYVGFLIYVCFAIIKPPAMWYWSVPPGGYYDRTVAIAVIIGWLIQGFGNWKLGKGAGRLTLTLVLFFFWQVLGWAASDIPELAQWHVIDQAKILLMFLIGISLIDTPRHAKALAWTMALSLGYLAYELNLSYYAGYNRAGAEGFAGLDNNCVAVEMACGAGLAMFLGFGERRLWLKALGLISAVLCAHTVMFCWSRGGMLGLICVGITGFLLIHREPKHYLLFLLLVALAFRLAGDQVRQRFLTVFVDPEERDTSANTRLEYWGHAWRAMQRNPLFGVGPGHWMYYCDQVGIRRIYIHSVWMQAGAETGFPGLGLLLAFYGQTVFYLYPLTRRKARVGHPWFPEAARMVIAGLVGYAAAGSFVSLVNLEIPYYLVLLGAGVLKVNSALLAQPATQWAASPQSPLESRRSWQPVPA